MDASALVAILAHEPEREVFLSYLLANPAVLSPVGYWETAISARRVLGDDGLDDLNVLLKDLGITVSPATSGTATIAIAAEARYGKRTSAKLNLGDCFAYALASGLDAPLLFKGDDFIQTDIRPAITA